MSYNYDPSKGNEYWKTVKTGGGYKKPKNRVKIFLPPGEERVTLFKMAEITAPGGLTLVVELPFPMSEGGIAKIAESIRDIGGTVEILNH